MAGRMRSNQRGFSPVESLAVILVIVLICLGGYYVWHGYEKPKMTTVNKSTTTNNSTSMIKVGPSTSSDQNLQNVDISPTPQPHKLSFTSVKADYQTKYDGNGLNIFTARMPQKVTGTCLFVFTPQEGHYKGLFTVTSKRVYITGEDTCILEIHSPEFIAKGWFDYSVQFTDPTNAIEFNIWRDKVFVWN